MIKITIIYDNTQWNKDLKADWGFSCLVETAGKTILFDTGANGPLLLENMKKTGIDPRCVDLVFISHDHWDHTGGLNDFLTINPVPVYIPDATLFADAPDTCVKIKDLSGIHENLYSTGCLDDIEQALVIKDGDTSVIITGCSHPGVDQILKQAKKIGTPVALLGGLHDFQELNLLEELQYICATHCTTHQSEIEELYPDKFICGGTGQVIKL